jgi:Zn-dependent protease
VKQNCWACRTAHDPEDWYCGGCGCDLREPDEDLAPRFAAAWQAEEAGQLSEALSQWRELLPLLPENSPLGKLVRSKAEALSQSLLRNEPPPTEKPGNLRNAAGALGVAALAIWKLKGVLLLFLTKWKLLFFGLTKLKTLFSLLAYLGIYWARFGWAFALGFVFQIYLHEMGHYWMMQRLGLRPFTPVFIPFLGAVTAMQQLPMNTVERARVGLAGPQWGLVATVICYALGWLLQLEVMLAIAHVGAFLNLFNLLAVWIFDGAAGMAPLSLRQRVMLLGITGVLFLIASEGILLILMASMAWRVWKAYDGSEEEPGDEKTFRDFALLLALLSLLSMLTKKVEETL